jgi:hypothetical protein
MGTTTPTAIFPLVFRPPSELPLGLMGVPEGPVLVDPSGPVTVGDICCVDVMTVTYVLVRPSVVVIVVSGGAVVREEPGGALVLVVDVLNVVDGGGGGSDDDGGSGGLEVGGLELDVSGGAAVVVGSAEELVRAVREGDGVGCDVCTIVLGVFDMVKLSNLTVENCLRRVAMLATIWLVWAARTWRKKEGRAV